MQESMQNEMQSPVFEVDQVNILLVDDKPGNLLAIAVLLKAPGYNLVKANSGKEALRYLLEMDFAVILLDVQMPYMDGFETASWIRKRAKSKHTPIIFVTAVEKSAEYVAKGYSLGAVDYLFKPVVPSFLRTKVSVFVELYRKTALEKKAKERLALMAEELARSNAELEQFAYIASHDLQEPLRKIQAFGERLQVKAGDSLDEKTKDYLGRMMNASSRMQSLINALLKYSRVTTKARAFVSVDLSDLVRKVLSDLEIQIKRIGGRIEVGDLPTIDADPLQMYQLFQNLISNALKFHNKGEAPVVEVRGKIIAGSERGAAAFSQKQKDRFCRITVQDNGIGFDEKYLDHIFKVFQRLHGRDEYEGSGIGLAICRKIVQRHGGGITAESKPGKGATFSITFPVEQTKQGDMP